MLRPTLLLCAALTVGATAAAARVRAPTDDDILQAACYPDVQRLCKDDIPDEKKITACMERKKAMISHRCTEAYKKVHGSAR